MNAGDAADAWFDQHAGEGFSAFGAFLAGWEAALAALDLEDPETENAVADAIVRLKGGGFLPLSERYPWRFPQIPPGKCGEHFDADPERRYTCELLAGHAGWHQETRWHEDLTPQTVSWNRAV